MNEKLLLGKPIEELSEEDILSKAAITEIFEIEDAVQQEQIKHAVRKRAKELKVLRTFESMFKAAKKQLNDKRKEYAVRLNGTTSLISKSEFTAELAARLTEWGVMFTTDGKNIKRTGYNVRLILEKDSTKWNFKRNLLTDRIEIFSRYWDSKGLGQDFTDTDFSYVADYIEGKYCGFSPTREQISQAIDIIANENSYHPIEQELRICCSKWDTKEGRIAEFFPKYLGAERSEYTTEVTQLLLFGMIARVLTPGRKFDYCIVIQDQKQGTGKSTICRMLALRDEWYTDSIKDFDNLKQYAEQLQGHWVIEMGEMIATARTKEVEQIKAAISATSDTFRPSYGKYARDYPRQCVFIGTTNNADFLPADPTGNRRFIPLPCNGRKARQHPLFDEEETREYIRQMWGEAFSKYIQCPDKNKALILPDAVSQQLEIFTKEATPEDPDEGIIGQWLEDMLEKPNYTDHKSVVTCVAMVWNEVLKRDDKKLLKIESRRIGGIFERLGFKRLNKTHSFKKYGKQRAWIFTPEEEEKEHFVPFSDSDEETIPF